MPFFRRGRMQLKRTMFNSFGSGGPLPPPLFNGNYWFSPLSNNGNDTITNGAFINQGLSIKNVDLTTGIQTIPSQTVATFPNHNVYGNSFAGDLVEPETTTQIPTDMSLWQDTTNSTVTYNDTTKESRWLFTGGFRSHRVFTSSSVTAGLDYTLSLFVKKGESQFLQITGSNGFNTTIVVNYDLVNGIANDQVGGVTLKDFGLMDLGDYFRVYLTLEATSTSAGRFILSKSNSLTSPRLPPTADSGAFTVKYPNFVQASYASSPIDAPLAATTRAQDVTSCPTSDALVDANHGLTESGGTISLAGTKFDGLLDNKVVGACFFDATTIKARVTAYNANTLTVDGSIDDAALTLHTSSYTVAEAEQIRVNAGDTPPTEFPDGSFRWLTFPPNATFSADFVLYNTDSAILFNLAWDNAVEETYAERIGNDLKFVHGQDELTVPYADLLEVGTLYNGKVTVTPTQLIGEVNGIEVGSMTRIDTRDAVYKSACYLGGYEDTVNSLLVSNFRVSDYVAPPPPQSSQLVVEQGGDDIFYINSDLATAFGIPVSGSLTPDYYVNGNVVAGLSFASLDQSLAIILEGENLGIDSVLVSLNGELITLNFNSAFIPGFSLFDAPITPEIAAIMQAGAISGQSIEFTAEEAPVLPDFADNGDWANNGDWNNG